MDETLTSLYWPNEMNNIKKKKRGRKIYTVKNITENKIWISKIFIVNNWNSERIAT